MKSEASKKQIGGNHYKHFAIQPTEFAVRNNLPFLEGNVVKYVCRHKFKGGRQDVEKAIHYLELLLEWEYDGTAKGRNARKCRRSPNTKKIVRRNSHR